MMDSNTDIVRDPNVKTILQVLPAMSVGGVERGTVEVAQALVRSGWRSIVASAGGQFVRELEKCGAEHIELPLQTKSPLAIRRNSHALAEIISDEKISLVHARSRAPAWSAHAAAQKANVPFVTTFHGYYGTGVFGLKKIWNRIMSKGRPVIAISEFIADHIIAEYHTDPKDVVLIHRGVDLSMFDPAAVTPARMIKLASEWRLPDDGLVVMLPGRLSRWKGQSLLISAIAELAKAGELPENLRCLMVAPQPARSSYRRSLDAKVRTLGLEGCVQIIDNCRDIAAAYMVTDVVVSGSTRPEAFGRVVAEAQAMGRPVVAPAFGGAPEILLPAVTGWLYTPSDPVSLAQSIARAIALTRDQRDELKRMAREHVAKNFTVEQMTDATLAVYDSVLNGAYPVSARNND